MTSHRETLIGHASIGAEFKPFVIAEISANHGGNLEAALELVDIAADAGAGVGTGSGVGTDSGVGAGAGASGVGVGSGAGAAGVGATRFGNNPKNVFGATFRCPCILVKS